MIEKSQRHRRFSRLIYLSGIVALFSWAAWLRFSLPLEPVADPDTWGYLLPATRALTGEGFIHSGRNFVYPGFLYVVLRIGGDFRAISVVQHLFGLAAGGFMLAACSQLRDFVRGTALPDLVYRFFGLAAVAIYLFAGDTVRTELQIRPEAVCGFLGMLNLFFVLRFTHRFFVQGDERAATRLAVATVFSAFVFGSVRPSFWLAALSSLIPVGFLFFRGGSRSKLTLLASALGAVLLLIVPERLLARNDEVDAVFLPTLLFAQHADIIRDQMANDLTSPSPPYPREWLARIHASLAVEIEKSSHSGRPYPSLGFDPEYLMYDPESIDSQLRREFHDDIVALCTFYRSYYFRAFLRQPGRMMGKIARQVSIFYGPRCLAYNCGRFIELHDDYAQSVAEVMPHLDRFNGYSAATEFMARSEQLAKTALRLEQRAYIRHPLSALSKRYVFCLIAALAVAAVVLARSPMRRQYGWFVAAVLFLYWQPFVTCFETAMVNSLEVYRYLTILLVFVIFAQCLTFLLILEILGGAFRTWRSAKVMRPAHPDLNAG